MTPSETFTSVSEGVGARSFGGVAPLLEFKIGRGGRVRAYYHSVAHVSTSLKIRSANVAGGVRRRMSGMPFFQQDFLGEGTLGLRGANVGQILEIHMDEDFGVDVREGVFLAQTGNVSLSHVMVGNLRTGFFGGSGFLINRFAGGKGGGTVWLYASGDANIETLEEGDERIIAANTWVCKDISVGLTARARFSAGAILGRRSVFQQTVSGRGFLATETI